MISRGKPPEHRPARPISGRTTAASAVIVLGIVAATWTVLLWRYYGAGPDVALDAIRTAGTLTVATGGAAALLLAARRQVHTERDSSEQRITELYTRAVDQLGADKAPVRLGGLHAPERLAHNNPAQRQTIVDVICAYLRMPFTPPDDQAPGEGTPKGVYRRYEQQRQELQVRLTAQHILSAHLWPKTKAAFWGNDIDLNLTGAHLHQLDLVDCHIRRAPFRWGNVRWPRRFQRGDVRRSRSVQRSKVHQWCTVRRGEVPRGRVVPRCDVCRGRRILVGGVQLVGGTIRGEVRGGSKLRWRACGPKLHSRPFADRVDHPRRAACERGGRKLAVHGT